jgi:hypothetical protein
MSNFAEIRPVEAALIDSDGRTDGHDEGNRVFGGYAKAPKDRTLDIYQDTAQVFR